MTDIEDHHWDLSDIIMLSSCCAKSDRIVNNGSVKMLSSMNGSLVKDMQNTIRLYPSLGMLCGLLIILSIPNSTRLRNNHKTGRTRNSLEFSLLLIITKDHSNKRHVYWMKSNNDTIRTTGGKNDWWKSGRTGSGNFKYSGWSNSIVDKHYTLSFWILY